MENSWHNDFDPEFSEYNPIFAELKAVKEIAEKKEKGFFAKLIESLTVSYLFLTD